MPTDGDDTLRQPRPDGTDPERADAVPSRAVTEGPAATVVDDRPDGGHPADEQAPGDADGPGTDGPDEPRERTLLRRLLGEGVLALDATPRARLTGWLWALGVTVLAGVLRFWDLATPHRLVFDETYYVKDAYSLLRYGYEGSWGDDAAAANAAFEAGDPGFLSSTAAYVVHPPVGKWLIAWGIQLGGGVESSFAWRLSAALFGTLAVLLIVRIARRLLASTALGVVAGLFLAFDGQAIVQSRTSLLDIFLMFFVLAAFGCLLLDREQARRRLAARTAAVLDGGGVLRWGPGLGMRWWRLAAGVMLGLAVGTKWSGLWFLAVFGLLTVLWDASARRTAGVRPWVRATLVKDAVVAFLVMVPTTLVVYVASWVTWFSTSGGWDRQWAVDNPGQGVQWLPPALRSLWNYHQGMWAFHTGLASEHTYASHPFGWIVQWRPTSFWYPAEVSGLTGDAALDACGAASCSQPVVALGNPVLWWAGAAAILVALYWLVVHRDWRAGAVLSGVVAGWLPWFAYTERTIFTFYTVVFVPWVVLTLVYVLGLLVGPRPPDDAPASEVRSHRWAVGGVVAFVVLVVGVGAFFYPVWAGWVIPYEQWRLRMWLPTWI